MSTDSTRRFRRQGVLSAALFIAGSLVFLVGGSQHPLITASLAPLGTEAFFEAFAEHVRHTADWQSMHVMILLGPVLWAAGAAALAPRAGAAESAGLRVGRMVLGLGASIWIVAFVLDGYSHLQLATDIGLAPTAAMRAELLRAFRLSATTMARLGLLSWTLIGVAMLILATEMLAKSRGRTRLVLGASGVLLGVWPIVAWAAGEFTPGPFTSPLWTLSAVAAALWYIAFGAAQLRRAGGPASQLQPGALPAGAVR